MRNTRNTARFLSFLTVLAVLLTAGIVLGINVSAEATTETSVETAQELVSALANDGTIVLTKDIYLGDAYTTGETWTPTTTPISATVTIKSGENGPYTIYRGVENQTAIEITVATPMFSMEMGANVTLTNVVLDGQKDVITDKATTGGAFYYYNATADTKFTTTLTLGKGAVIQNFAAKQGGAVGFTYATLIIDGGTISNNKTSESGGGVDANNTRFTFTDGTISNNTAGVHGGGVILRNVSVLTMGENSIVSNCTATDAGGGICVYGSKDQTLSAGTVTNCTAKRGGGIATLTNTITVTLSGVTISNNEATSTSTNQGGGGVYFIGSTCVLSGSDILDNEAKRGGGIFFTTGTLTMEDGTVSGNTATVNGGGIAFTTGTLILSGDGKISGNTATSNGGGVYTNETTSHFWMLGGELSYNKAQSLYGAGLYSKSFTYIGGGTITGNIMDYGSNKISDMYGGDAVCIFDGTLYLAGGTIKDNTNKHKGNDTEEIYLATAHKEVFLRASTSAELPKAYIGGTVTLTGVTIPAQVAEADNIVKEGDTITSSNPLIMDDNDSRNFVYYCQYTDANEQTFKYDEPEHVILMSDLPAKSKVVFADNDATLGYFLTLDAGYTTPSTATLNAICLAGADSLYNATVSGTTLAWPTADAKPYQIYQNAGLSDDIAYRFYFACRDAANKSLPTVTFDGKKVEFGTVSADLANNLKAPLYEGLSYVEIKMAPKNIKDTITIADDEDTPKAYILADYLAGLKSKDGETDKNEELDALVDAILNYASAAQVRFDHNTDNLANSEYKTTLKEIEKQTWSLVNDDTAKYFNQVVVNVGSKVSVYVVLNTGTLDGCTVEFGGHELTAGKEYSTEFTNEYAAIRIENISASDLLKTIEVSYNGSVLTYSVPAYAYKMQESTDETLVDIVRALYAYAVAADAYATANAAN